MTTKKLFAVRVSVTAMVWAEDALDADTIANEDGREIWSDASFPNTEVIGSDIKLDQLDTYGWDERCIPYGHDGNTTIKEIFDAQPNPA